MQGLREIKAANKFAAGPNYRVQRDRLAQVLRRVLEEEVPRGRTPVTLGAVEEAGKVLVEIYGDRM